MNRLISIFLLVFVFSCSSKKSKEETINQSNFQPKEIRLEISKESLHKIEKIRAEAFEKGFLTTDDDSWVKAKIIDGDSILKVKIRLKGDLLDHFKENKYSYRVKVRKGKTWNRLRTFSLHSPEIREFLKEWFYHLVLQKEGVLTPRTDFIKLYINNDYKGVYSYEEHFEKQLLESQNRREGPIVKFSEDGVWQKKLRNIQNKTNISTSEMLTDLYESSKIGVFKESRTLADSNLSKQFFEAKKLMNQYKFDTKQPADIFDVEKLASLYAMADVFGAFHGLFWNNQRFYYNPVIQKLEPIAYDGFSHAENWNKRPFYGYGLYNPRNKHLDGLHVFYNQLFLDSTFMAAYVQKLVQFSDTNYVKSLYKEFGGEISDREFLISTEFENYRFDKSLILNKSREITTKIYPFNNVSLKAYKDDKNLKVFNHHKLPLILVGEGQSIDDFTTYDVSKLLPVQINWTEPYEFQKISLKDNSSRVLIFKMIGDDKLYFSEIEPYKFDEEDLSNQKISTDFNILKNPIEGFEIVNNKVIVSGEVLLKEFVVIPKNYELIIKQGAKLDFINGSGLVSYSPIVVDGTEEKPVKITSSDGSASGFTILQANGNCTLNNVVFDNFNTLNKDNWSLTGAVTFYESDVIMNNVNVKNAQCEDALNIIRSDFEIEQLTIDKCFSDGFDADFCTGKITNSVFLNTGNDGMDFSGSFIEVSKCLVNHAGDKGLSSGEQATITAKNLKVMNANIGVASKDLSKVTLENIILENCKVGLTAYQKKPEYGSAKILTSDVDFKNVEIENEIEKGSQLELK